jgi:hypothetical protein
MKEGREGGKEGGKEGWWGVFWGVESACMHREVFGLLCVYGFG